jgi:MerR family transcriptional regulator, redox-sensitive transcriptional activator SoxR
VRDELLTIGELAARAGRRASSIRYYEQIGLLPEPIRISGQRRYPEDCVRTLALVDVAQRAGLSLGQIKAVLAEADAAAALRRAASERLPELTAEIDRAVLARQWLELASLCECHDLVDCPLFANRGGPAPVDCPDVSPARLDASA